MRIRLYIFICSMFISVITYSQPDPSIFYPERIKEITKKLESDSLNYKLIWERLKMKVSLLEGHQFNDVFVTYHNDTSIKYFSEIDYEFKIIYENVIKPKDFSFVEEEDYLIYRISFYGITLQLDKALADTYYLKDSVSSSKYFGQKTVGYDLTLDYFFRLFVLKKDYGKALEAINSILAEEKKRRPKSYFVYSSSYSHEKVKLFEYFNKRENIIPYLKELTIESFSWYFEKAKLKDTNAESWFFTENEYYYDKKEFIYFINEVKAGGFAYLERLIYYMKQLNSPELSKYEKIYSQLRYRVSVNFETINPKINDKELKELLYGF